MKETSVQKGNLFCRLVASNLQAAGFENVTMEVRDDFKKTDISATYFYFEGPVRYRFEAKNYEGTVPKDECIKFIIEYGALIDDRKIDRAWFVSRGPISPDGRALINAKFSSGLKCFTFDELQRSLFNIDGYLRDLVNLRVTKGITNFYVKPHTLDGSDLEAFVRVWIDSPSSQPLAIIGSYGQGKSTFAAYISSILAEEALLDPTRRVPILVPLGDIVDEQSLDGLIGKTLASSHRAVNYHFSLFKSLNKSGRFILLFDGLDEMKHGMTLNTFERNIKRLLELDNEYSKIIFLGRDTAFHNDTEFLSIISGRKMTKSGISTTSLTRREIQHITIAGFSADEARFFVKNYIHHRIKLDQQSGFTSYDDAKIYNKVSNVLNSSLEDLICRPVHAQMICEVALRTDMPLTGMLLFDLYDLFVHYLLERESEKPGRFPGFGLDVRRRFNAAFAWWLWECGKSSTVTLTEAPANLCQSVISGIEHDFDDDGLKRELMAGCLVEKNEGTVYFGHRSIQEFLVAEYLVSSYESIENRRVDIGKIWGMLSPVVESFILDFIKRSISSQTIALKWLYALGDWRSENIAMEGIFLFTEIGKLCENDIREKSQSPWFTLINYFIINRSNYFLPTTEEAKSYAIKLINNTRPGSKSNSAVGAIILICSIDERLVNSEYCDSDVHLNDVMELLMYCLRVEWVNEIVKSAGRLYEFFVDPEDYSMLWALLYGLSESQDKLKIDYIEIQLSDLMKSFGKLAEFSFQLKNVNEKKMKIPLRRFSRYLIESGYNLAGVESALRLISDISIRRKIVLGDPESYKQNRKIEYRIGGAPNRGEDYIIRK